MTRATLQDWLVRTAERLGIPCAMLAAVLFGLWCTLQWFGEEIAKPLVKTHLEFVLKQTEINERNTDALEKISDVEQSQNELIEELHDQLVRRPGDRPP